MARRGEGSVVKREKIRIEQVEGKYWDREIRFNPDTGIFSVRMPEGFRKDFPDTPTPSGKTMDAAREKFFRELEATVARVCERVLAFETEISTPKGIDGLLAGSQTLLIGAKS